MESRAASWLTTARAIAVRAQERSRAEPPPLGTPYFGLDIPAGAVDLLDVFRSEGIFRKYERVLLGGDPLGGAARWCSVRFGCSVLSVHAHSGATRAALWLHRRAGAPGACSWLCAAPARLPIRSGVITHAWMLGGAEVVRAESADELARVVRTGGFVAVACESHKMAETVAQRLSAQGFIAVRRFAWHWCPGDPVRAGKTPRRVVRSGGEMSSDALAAPGRVGHGSERGVSAGGVRLCSCFLGARRDVVQGVVAMAIGVVRRALIATLATFTVAGTAAATRVPCEKILQEANRMTARRATAQIHPSVIARELGTEQDWVERCLSVYGRTYRNVTRPGETDRLTDETVERWETGAWEGVAQDELTDEPFTGVRERAEMQLRANRRRNLRRRLLDEDLGRDLLDEPVRR